jgi:hypothetical protein
MVLKFSHLILQIQDIDRRRLVFNSFLKLECGVLGTGQFITEGSDLILSLS